MVAGVKMSVIGEGIGLLSDFRELSFCGPCGPFFISSVVISHYKTLKRGENLIIYFMSFFKKRVKLGCR